MKGENPSPLDLEPTADDRSLAKDAPHYIPGTITMSACMAAQTIIILSWRFWLVYNNNKRAKAIEAEGISSEEVEKRGQQLGSEDVTDLKNPYFMSVVMGLCSFARLIQYSYET